MIRCQNRAGLTALVLSGFSLLLSAGCTSKQASPDEAIKFFGLTYINYQQIWNRPPANWDELLTLADGEGLETDLGLLNQVRESDYVVVWKQDCRSPDAQERVLAYESSTLDGTGRVLFADGSLRSLSSIELRERLKDAENAG